MFDTKPLHCAEFGDPNGPAVVLLHGLGLTHDIWQPVISQLPQNLRILAIDLPGHGQSVDKRPVRSMGAIVRRLETAFNEHNVKDAVCVGHCLGGLAAQGLAEKRLDLIRALVLCNTAAKIGHPPHWDKRIELVKAGQGDQVRSELVKKWFAPRELTNSTEILSVFSDLKDDDFIAAMQSMRTTDFYTQTASLRLPALGIAGYNDAFTPSDMVKETIDLIPGSTFQLLRKSGHVSSFDQPEAVAGHLNDFLKSIGHI